MKISFFFIAVFRQGDIGTNWYTVLNGSLDVIVKDSNNSKVREMILIVWVEGVVFRVWVCVCVNVYVYIPSWFMRANVELLSFSFRFSLFFFLFLVADKRLYKRLCPSVRWSVGRSVRW